MKSISENGHLDSENTLIMSFQMMYESELIR